MQLAERLEQYTTTDELTAHGMIGSTGTGSYEIKWTRHQEPDTMWLMWPAIQPVVTRGACK